MNFGNVASAKLSVYQLTGGANGLASEIYINFDKRTGGKLSLANMIADTAALRTANIEAFRKVRGNETGDMFMALKDLPLPEYAGISAEGLHVHYNPYEVASNAFGSTDYTIPAATIRPMLNKDLFPGR